MPKLDQVSVNGTTYEIVPEVAPLFNTSTAYAVGDYVIKDAVLYRFTANHTGAWTGTDAVEVTVGNELTDLKTDLSENVGDLKSALSENGIEYNAFSYNAQGGQNYSFAFSVGVPYRIVNNSQSGSVTITTRAEGSKVEDIVTNLDAGNSIVFFPSAIADQIRIYYNNAGSNEVLVIYGNEVNKAFAKNVQNVLVSDDYDLIVQCPFANGGFDLAHAVESTNYKRLLSDYIELQSGSSISISSVAGYLSKLYIFTDKQDKSVESETAFVDGTLYTNTLQNVRYVRISVKKIDESVISPSSMDDFQIYVENTLRKLGDQSDVRWIDGYYVDSNGKFTELATQSIAIMNVQAFSGGKQRVKTRIGTGTCVAYYDEHMFPIEVKTYQTYGSFVNIYDIPPSAKKCAISCTSSYKESLFATECFGLIAGIENIHKSSAVEYVPSVSIFGLTGNKADFVFNSDTRVEDIYNWFEILTEVFDKNITKVKLCDSTTPTGEYAEIDSSTYPIYAYIIQGNNYISGNDIIVHAGIHGPNWEDGDGIMSPVCVAYFIKDLLVNHSNNPYLSYLRNHCRLLVTPILNPWGYQNAKRQNGRGIDCNRNWDIHFSAGTGGDAPFSENETLYYKNYIVTNFSNAKFCIDLHTRGTGMLPNTDKRWLAKTTVGSILEEDSRIVSEYLINQYGGAYDLSQDTVENAPSTTRAYFDLVLNIPATLIECACGVGPNRSNIVRNSELVVRQYTTYIGAMIQKYLETTILT